jgi:hypothetical protein
MITALVPRANIEINAVLQNGSSAAWKGLAGPVARGGVPS